MAHRCKRPDTKRRAYRPQAERRNTGNPLTDAGDAGNPLEVAINRAMLLLPTERAEILERYTAAFKVMRAGHGCADEWAKLVDATNIGTVLAHRRIASDHKATFAAASAALRDLHDRHARTGSWTLKGTEIAALDLALLIHKIQLDHCSRGELALAVQTVINRTRAALSGAVAPGTTVCLPGQPGITQQVRTAQAGA